MSHTFAQKFEVVRLSLALFLVGNLALEAARFELLLQFVEFLLRHGRLLDDDLTFEVLERSLVEFLRFQLLR